MAYQQCINFHFQQHASIEGGDRLGNWKKENDGYGGRVSFQIWELQKQNQREELQNACRVYLITPPT